MWFVIFWIVGSGWSVRPLPDVPGLSEQCHFRTEATSFCIVHVDPQNNGTHPGKSGVDRKERSRYQDEKRTALTEKGHVLGGCNDYTQSPDGFRECLVQRRLEKHKLPGSHFLNEEIGLGTLDSWPRLARGTAIKAYDFRGQEGIGSGEDKNWTIEGGGNQKRTS